MIILTQKPRPSIQGFTLVEILMAIALFSVFISVVIIAINPNKHLADSRDMRREADVYSIVHSIYQYSADHEGELPSAITAEEREICVSNAISCSGLVDLSVLTNDEVYLIETPVDPQCEMVPGVCSSNGTGYYIKNTQNGNLQVRASSSENKIILITQ